MKDKLLKEYEDMIPKIKKEYDVLKGLEQEYKDKIINKITVGQKANHDEAVLLLEKLRIQYDKWNAINNGMHELENKITKKYGINPNEIHTLYIASKLLK